MPSILGILSVVSREYRKHGDQISSSSFWILLVHNFSQRPWVSLPSKLSRKGNMQRYMNQRTVTEIYKFIYRWGLNDIWTKEPWLKFINSYIVACYLLFRKLMEGLCSRWCTNYFVGYRLPTTLLLWYVMISWLLPLDLKWKWGWATSINTI